jgi:hypothetical protein
MSIASPLSLSENCVYTNLFTPSSAPSAEEIDENRKDMLHGFAESF